MSVSDHELVRERSPPPSQPSPPRPIIAIFDFDMTLVDDNTDTFVIEEASAELRQIMRQRHKSGMQWTALMASMMEELASAGFSTEWIAETLGRIDMPPPVIDALTRLRREAKADLRIVSDSNAFFIDAVCRAKNLHQDVFTEIVTNPAEVDADADILRVRPFLPTPHSCKLCTAVNMCKGDVVRRIMDSIIHSSDTTTVPYTSDMKSQIQQEQQEQQQQQQQAQQKNVPSPRIIYVGDGGNDFCPGAALRESDLLLARAGYRLEKRLEHEGPVRARTIVWETFEQLAEALLEAAGL